MQSSFLLFMSESFFHPHESQCNSIYGHPFVCTVLHMVLFQAMQWSDESHCSVINCTGDSRHSPASVIQLSMAYTVEIARSMHQTARH